MYNLQAKTEVGVLVFPYPDVFVFLWADLFPINLYSFVVRISNSPAASLETHHTGLAASPGGGWRSSIKSEGPLVCVEGALIPYICPFIEAPGVLQVF